jgi:hypothetical protein
MDAFVVWFPDAKRYLGMNSLPQVPMIEAVGWRPTRWVQDIIDAEKFGSQAAAELFVRSCGQDMRTMFDNGMVEIQFVPPKKPLWVGE